MQTQYSALGNRIDLYFLDYILAMEVDEKGHEDEIKRQKALEKELSCECVRVNPDKNDFNIFKTINEIHRKNKKIIKKSTKNYLIDELSKELLRLENESK